MNHPSARCGRTSASILDCFFIFTGTWTLLCWLLVLMGGSFAFLLWLPWIPAVFTAVSLRYPSAARRDVVVPAAEALSLAEVVRAVGSALAVVGVYAFSGSYLAFWLLAVVLLLVACRYDPARVARASGGSAPDLSRFGTIALCFLVVAITLAAHRPDPDDGFYLSIVTTALDRPSESLLAFDGMYGEPNLPLLESWYRLKTYEPLVAVLAWHTGIDPKQLYYLTFPALLAVLVVIANREALRALGGEYVTVGVVAVIVVILCWGDRHQAFGNFGFVRLFQGKAILVSVCMPAAVLYATRFAQQRDRRSLLLLVLCQVAAVGISGSALVAVPTATVAGLAGWWLGSDSDRTLALGAAVSVAVAAFAIFAFMDPPFERWLRLSWSAVMGFAGVSGRDLQRVLGGGPRELFALVALLVAPQLAPARTRRALLGMVLALLLLAMNPLVATSLSYIYQRISWRLFWAVPFPLLIGLLVQRLAATRVPGTRGRLPGLALAACALAVFAAMPGKWTLSPRNGTRLGMPGPKVPVEHLIAGGIVASSKPSDLVLAPTEVALWVPTYRRHPRLVGIRRNYYLMPDLREKRARLRLVDFISEGVRSPRRLRKVLTEIDRRGVDVVVLPSNVPSTGVVNGLTERGCQPVTDDDLGLLPATLEEAGYRIWRCAGGPVDRSDDSSATR